jgi:hypothetical protein
MLNWEPAGADKGPADGFEDPFRPKSLSGAGLDNLRRIGGDPARCRCWAWLVIGVGGDVERWGRAVGLPEPDPLESSAMGVDGNE